MKPRLAIISFVLLLLFVNTCPAFCQQIIFNKVIPPEGKFNALVTCITQDINGYMWFATNSSGLYSYDGYRFIAYVHDDLNPHSLASDRVESIYADSNGMIWVGTLDRGLDRLDPETGIFTHFQHHADVPSSLGCDSVFAILMDKQGTFWIGTLNGLDQFDPKTNKFIHYRCNATDSASISNNIVRAIYEDRQGTLWLGTGEGGLNRMNKKTGTFARYLNIPGNIHSLANNNNVRAIFEDNQGVLWIGTGGNGLHKMDRKQGTFERIVYDPAHPEKISGPALTKESSSFEQITFITQDAAGSYWIGTLEGGLNYYNPIIGKTIHYPGTANSGFNDKGAWWAFTSRDGILWISSDWTRGNLYRIDPFRSEIPHYLIPGGVVWFYEEPNGIFWTAGEELIRNDIDKGIKKRYKIVNPTAGQIRIIKEDREGNFWLGTWQSGLRVWNKEKENFITYKNDPKNKSSLSNNDVHTIYVDRDSNLWIGTHPGLNLWNGKTGSFTRYFINPNDSSLSGEGTFAVSAILRDNTGKLWVGEWGGGVNLFNRESNKFKNYLRGTRVKCLYEDADAVLWLGANDGLYKYDRSADAFIRFKVSGSFVEIPNVSHMVEDNQKYLWLQTSDGMMSVNPRRNETRNYGISKTSFGSSWSYCYKGRDGKLYFTEPGGYYSFYPTDFTQYIKPPEIIFTGFSLGDKPIKPGKQSPLKESISKTTEIRLGYNQNVFSFEFAAIDYTNPESNQHLFMLENYGNNWQQAGSDRKASYFNIPPGKYVFRVKAINSKGAWSEKKINIIILPPWWQTWWFRIFAGITLLLLFYGIYRWRTATLRKQKRILEQTVKVRTAEVVQKNAEVEKRNLVIQKEKEKSDELLLNILPYEVAEELKEKGYTTAKSFDEVTVLFSDIKGFTDVAERMTAQELVKEIDTYFSAFDGIIQKYGLEKIKTIGDAYIAAGGLPEKNSATAQNVVEAAIAMQQEVEKLKQERVSSNKPYFELRIGIHTGPVVAGVVGIKKFQYDIWGDTVNLAARMEQSGVPGKINISQHTYELIKDQFSCVHRGRIEAKNKGEIDMYFVE